MTMCSRFSVTKEMRIKPQDTTAHLPKSLKLHILKRPGVGKDVEQLEFSHCQQECGLEEPFWKTVRLLENSPNVHRQENE